MLWQEHPAPPAFCPMELGWRTGGSPPPEGCFSRAVPSSMLGEGAGKRAFLHLSKREHHPFGREGARELKEHCRKRREGAGRGCHGSWAPHDDNEQGSSRQRASADAMQITSWRPAVRGQLPRSLFSSLSPKPALSCPAKATGSLSAGFPPLCFNEQDLEGNAWTHPNKGNGKDKLLGQVTKGHAYAFIN